jgi:hypothetical protein
VAQRRPAAPPASTADEHLPQPDRRGGALSLGGVLLVVLKSGMIHSIVLSEAAGAAHAALTARPGVPPTARPVVQRRDRNLQE